MIIVLGGVEALASRPVSHRRHAIRTGRLDSKVAINRFVSISIIVRTETAAATARDSYLIAAFPVGTIASGYTSPHCSFSRSEGLVLKKPSGIRE